MVNDEGSQIVDFSPLRLCLELSVDGGESLSAGTGVQHDGGSAVVVAAAARVVMVNLIKGDKLNIA